MDRQQELGLLLVGAVIGAVAVQLAWLIVLLRRGEAVTLRGAIIVLFAFTGWAATALISGRA